MERLGRESAQERAALHRSPRPRQLHPRKRRTARSEQTLRRDSLGAGGRGEGPGLGHRRSSPRSDPRQEAVQKGQHAHNRPSEALCARGPGGSARRPALPGALLCVGPSCWQARSLGSLLHNSLGTDPCDPSPVWLRLVHRSWDFRDRLSFPTVRCLPRRVASDVTSCDSGEDDATLTALPRTAFRPGLWQARRRLGQGPGPSVRRLPGAAVDTAAPRLRPSTREDTKPSGRQRPPWNNRAGKTPSPLGGSGPPGTTEPRSAPAGAGAAHRSDRRRSVRAASLPPSPQEEATSVTSHPRCPARVPCHSLWGPRRPGPNRDPLSGLLCWTPGGAEGRPPWGDGRVGSIPRAQRTRHEGESSQQERPLGAHGSAPRAPVCPRPSGSPEHRCQPVHVWAGFFLFYKRGDTKSKDTRGNIKHFFIIAIIKAKSLKTIGLDDGNIIRTINHEFTVCSSLLFRLHGLTHTTYHLTLVVQEEECTWRSQSTAQPLP